jgi:hypothetical protein
LCRSVDYQTAEYSNNPTQLGGFCKNFNEFIGSPH